MTKTASNANDPTVFATITFLPTAPINRKSADAIWLIQTSKKYCLMNLQVKQMIQLCLADRRKLCLEFTYQNIPTFQSMDQIRLHSKSTQPKYQLLQRL